MNRPRNYGPRNYGPRPSSFSWWPIIITTLLIIIAVGITVVTVFFLNKEHDNIPGHRHPHHHSRPMPGPSPGPYPPDPPYNPPYRHHRKQDSRWPYVSKNPNRQRSLDDNY